MGNKVYYKIYKRKRADVQKIGDNDQSDFIYIPIVVGVKASSLLWFLCAMSSVRDELPLYSFFYYCLVYSDFYFFCNGGLLILLGIFKLLISYLSF